MNDQTNGTNGANWARRATFVFGVWAAMLPLSAAIIGYYQNRIAESTDAYRRELAQLRLDTVTKNGEQDRELERLGTNQLEVIRRLGVLEQQHIPRQ